MWLLLPAICYMNIVCPEKFIVTYTLGSEKLAKFKNFKFQEQNFTTCIQELL